MAKERIGILCGSFNPVHLGHIQLAVQALKSASLDRVLLIPDGISPHRDDLAPAEDRWRLLCVAACQEKEVIPCRMEIDRNETVSASQTLKDLKKAYPKAEFFYILGADAVMRLSHWPDLDALVRRCTFLVAPRVMQGQSGVGLNSRALVEEKKRLAALGARFQNLDMPLMDVSATQIRDALREERDTPLFSAPLREYCSAMGLYGMPLRLPQARQWIPKLFDALSVKRFSHTLAVAFTARNLAKNHRVDPYKAECAGLLHDCAKCMPLSEMQKICMAHDLTMDALALSSGNLLHSIVGSYLAASEYGIQDPDILRAISCHTTGKVGMTKLDMVVFLADKIEPTRAAYPTLNKVRMLSPLSLERALLLSLEGTEAHVRDGKNTLHPMTLQTISWLRTLPETRGMPAFSGTET